jgi:hypothetical protein
VNFNGAGWAEAFAALSFIAWRLICYFAFAGCLINEQNLLRAKLHALFATNAEIFVYQDNLIHSQIFNQTIGNNYQKPILRGES